MLRELYHETIIDHGRNPRHFGVLPEANHIKEGFNPLCGDKIKLFVDEHNGVIRAVAFDGSGCAISMASASLMAEHLKGKTLKEAQAIFDLFHLLIMKGELTVAQQTQLGKLRVLSGVCEFPARVKCATLAWHTLNALLLKDQSTVSTE